MRNATLKLLENSVTHPGMAERCGMAKRSHIPCIIIAIECAYDLELPEYPHIPLTYRHGDLFLLYNDVMKIAKHPLRQFYTQMKWPHTQMTD